MLFQDGNKNSRIEFLRLLAHALIRVVIDCEEMALECAERATTGRFQISWFDFWDLSLTNPLIIGVHHVWCKEWNIEKKAAGENSEICFDEIHDEIFLEIV